MSNIVRLEDKKHVKIPLRGLTEEARNALIFDLGDWLARALSLHGEKSAERLEVLLPMIKNSAWGLSILEIKKAFEYYIEGQLSIEPRDNYLTAILFSKIIKEYKVAYLSKKMDAIPQKTEDQLQKEKEYNDALMEDAVKRGKEQWKKNKTIDKYFQGQYLYLKAKGEFKKIPNVKELANKIFKEQTKLYKERLKFEVPLSREDGKRIKNEIALLEVGDTSKSSEITKNSQREILKTYYSL